MQFLVDAHHIGTRSTGNEEWATHVANGLAALLAGDGSDDTVIFGLASRAIPIIGNQVAYSRLHSQSFKRLAWDLPRIARRERADAILVQYTAPFCATPVVVAIHDLSFADPASVDWIPRAERTRMRATIRWSAQRARRIIALSNFTARDLENRWDIDPARIFVAHPAVGEDRLRRLREVSRIRQQHTNGPLTVLAVGNVLPRKNLLMLAKAVRIVRRRGLDVELRLVGQIPPAGRSAMTELQQVGGSWLHVSGYVTEAELVAAYAAADVFCFPSLYEGFGLPVLEAMAAGVPTVVSNTSALPEAAGQAGLGLDPHDPDAWADTLQAILVDSKFANEMRSAGLARSRQFSWANTATLVLRALREAGA